MRTSEKRRRSTTATYLERVNLAIDHIVTHLHEPLRLRQIAGVARLSPFHFHRVFQALVGSTPADFVKRLRLEKAVGIMAGARSPSLTSIAHACGFSSSSDFSRCFKQHFQVTPREFDVEAWRRARGDRLEATVQQQSDRPHLERLPQRHNPDRFRVRICGLAVRSVAYIRVARPYQGDSVLKAAQRLVAWSERLGFADGQWLGYQWDNPEITSLEDCRYYVAVEAEHFAPKGEVGRFRFPPMTVAEVEIRGDLELELRALQWLYGTWLPRSGYVPDDHPCFEAWIGRPFARGTEHFELRLQLPIRRL
ncbi:MAG TPA: AraC family transcriptional regulator [Planctomycetaceae bacterium]|nr:AraC family transcriptional regulator [Planctomycetaceae bacterium]